MRFHAVISIILGFVVFFILHEIAVWGFGLLSVLGNVLYYVSVLIGGFVATYLAKKMRIRYGIYEGVLIIIFLNIMHPFYDFINLGIAVLLFAGVGGLFGEMAGKNQWNNGFSPIIAFISGSAVTFVIWFIVTIIIYLMYPADSSKFILQDILTAELIGALFIGGFIATFIAKEQKIQYGIYMGIVTVIITTILALYALNKGYPTYNAFNPIVLVIATAAYILAPTIGSYLGITAVKR